MACMYSTEEKGKPVRTGTLPAGTVTIRAAACSHLDCIVENVCNDLFESVRVSLDVCGGACIVERQTQLLQLHNGFVHRQCPLHCLRQGKRL
jgi:hypothetical protein